MRSQRGILLHPRNKIIYQCYKHHLVFEWLIDRLRTPPPSDWWLEVNLSKSEKNILCIYQEFFSSLYPVSHRHPTCELLDILSWTMFKLNILIYMINTCCCCSVRLLIMSWGERTRWGNRDQCSLMDRKKMLTNAWSEKNICPRHARNLTTFNASTGNPSTLSHERW